MSIAPPALQYSISGGSNNPVGGTSIAVSANAALTVSLVSTTGITFASFTVSSPNSFLNGANSSWNGQGVAGITLFIPPAGGSFIVNVSVSDGQNTSTSSGSFFCSASTSATNSAGLVVSTAASTSAYDFFNAKDFGLSETNADNIPALNAVVAAAVADPFTRRIFIPRPAVTNGIYEIRSPWVIAAQKRIYIHFENQDGGLRKDFYIGPTFICCPQMQTPTIAQDGSTGFYGVVFSGSLGTPFAVGDPFMYLTAVDTMNLGNCATFTYETWYSPVDFVNQVFLFASYGSQRVNDAATVAFQLSILTNGHVQVTFTTANSGVQAITSTNALSTGVRQKISFTYDGSFGFLHIGGTYDAGASVAATGNIQQGFEDMIIGNRSPQWPYGQATASSPHGSLYQTRWSSTARYTKGVNYTPETTPIANTDDNTMLLWTPSPTCIVNSTAALMLCTCQDIPHGIGANCPVYIQWESVTGAQVTGPYIDGWCDSSSVGGQGIWLNRCPDTYYTNIRTIGNNYGVTLYNNCYNTVSEGKSFVNVQGRVGSVGSKLPAANWAWQGNTMGVANIASMQIAGVASYAVVLCNFSGQITRGYWITTGHGCIFIKGFGGPCEILFTTCDPGDEGGSYSEHCVLVTSQDTLASPGIVLNVQAISGNWQQTGTSGKPIIELDGCSQMVMAATPWPGNPANAIFLMHNNPSVPPIVAATQNLSFTSNVEKPWWPAVGAPGTGRVIVQAKESLKAGITLPDADSAITSNQFVYGKWVLSGTLTAGRKLLCYLGSSFAGVQRTVVNGTGQIVTIQGSTDGSTGSGSSVAIGAGKRAIVACEDGSNWVRVTADT